MQPCMSRRFITLSDEELSEGVDMGNTSHYSAREIQHTPMTGKDALMIMCDKPEASRRMLLRIYWDPLREVKS